MLRTTLTATIVSMGLLASAEAQDSNSHRLIGVQSSSAGIRQIHSLGDESANSQGNVPLVRAATTISSKHWEPGSFKPTPMVAPAINQDESATPSLSQPVLGELEPAESRLNFGGWIQTGFHSNSTALFNDRPDKVNLHQLWFYLEREAERRYDWDWGFRVDLTYGTDAAKTQSFGNPPGTWDFANGWDHGAYAWAMPQAYAELAKDKLSLKLGHFFTLVGYEVVTAPDNFFYSHAYTMFNSEPFTHTGAIASYDVDDSTTLHGGWTLGWDTGFNQLNGGSSFLGGFSKSLAEDLTFTYIATAGDFGWRGAGYSHSLVFDYQLAEKLNYILQSDLVSTDQSGGKAIFRGPLNPPIQQRVVSISRR